MKGGGRMEIKTKLKAPSMPNFAIIDADKSHSGNTTVDIASFTAEDHSLIQIQTNEKLQQN